MQVIISLCMLFRKLGLSLAKDDIVQLKEAYKWIIHPQLSEELSVPTDGKVLCCINKKILFFCAFDLLFFFFHICVYR